MNKKNTFTFLIYLFLCHTQLFSNNIVNGKKTLEQSKIYMQKGNYKKALAKILTINPRNDLELHDDIKQAYELLAISYWRVNKKEEAKQTITDLLLIDNQASLDAFITPPELFKVFSEEKAKIEAKKIIIAAPKITSTKEIKNNNIYYNFIPFGLNHYHANSKNKAIVQFSLQTSFLGINIASFWVKKHYENKFYQNSTRKNEYNQAFKATQTVQLTALAALFASYLFSTIDSLIEYYN